MSKTNTVTRDEYDSFVQAYDWFNERLFDDRLPPCLITLQRHAYSRGYYSHERFGRRRGSSRVSEIALNPDTFCGRNDESILSTLVHEMVHLWQFRFGSPGRNRYHNRQWAAKMIEVGLIPTNTGEPDGRQTGDRVTHYVEGGGRFQTVHRELADTGFRLKWESAEGNTPGSVNLSKTKFICPKCNIRVWGAPSLKGKLGCLPCGATLRVGK